MAKRFEFMPNFVFWHVEILVRLILIMFALLCVTTPRRFVDTRRPGAKFAATREKFVLQSWRGHTLFVSPDALSPSQYSNHVPLSQELLSQSIKTFSQRTRRAEFSISGECQRGFSHFAPSAVYLSLAKAGFLFPELRVGNF